MSKAFGRKTKKLRKNLIAFLAVSLHEEPKNTIQNHEIRPQKSQEKAVGSRYVPFFFFFLRA
jgi:hypothetical protein